MLVLLGQQARPSVSSLSVGRKVGARHGPQIKVRVMVRAMVRLTIRLTIRVKRILIFLQGSNPVRF